MKVGRKYSPGLLRKTHQQRADLPALGPNTIEALHAAGMLGVAYEAGKCLLLEKEEAVRRADAYELFMIGVKD